MLTFEARPQAQAPAFVAGRETKTRLLAEFPGALSLPSETPEDLEAAEGLVSGLLWPRRGKDD